MSTFEYSCDIPNLSKVDGSIVERLEGHLPPNVKLLNRASSEPFYQADMPGQVPSVVTFRVSADNESAAALALAQALKDAFPQVGLDATPAIQRVDAPDPDSDVAPQGARVASRRFSGMLPGMEARRPTTADVLDGPHVDHDQGGDRWPSCHAGLDGVIGSQNPPSESPPASRAETGTQRTEPRATSNDRPGDPSVYAQIRSTTDCGELQATFDRAADNNDRYEGGEHLHRVTLSYMEAADDRMRSIGCYD